MHCIHSSLEDWAKTYSGPKFNFIYLDDSDHTNSQEILIIPPDNKFISTSSYIFTWNIIFIAGHTQLSNFVWAQSDKHDTTIKDGIEPAYNLATMYAKDPPSMMRRIKNTYIGPRQAKPWHKDQKSEPMLKYFFSGFINQHTDFIDLACKDPAPLRAALALGARTVLGICPSRQLTDKINDDVGKFLLLRKAAKVEP